MMSKKIIVAVSTICLLVALLAPIYGCSDSASQRPEEQANPQPNEDVDLDRTIEENVFLDAVEHISREEYKLRSSDDEALIQALEQAFVRYEVFCDPEDEYQGPSNWGGNINGAIVSFWRPSELALVYKDDESGWRVYKYFIGYPIQKYLEQSDMYDE